MESNTRIKCVLIRYKVLSSRSRTPSKFKYFSLPWEKNIKTIFFLKNNGRGLGKKWVRVALSDL